MNSTFAGWLQVGLLVAALAACYIPLGNYIAKIFTTEKHWRVEHYGADHQPYRRQNRGVRLVSRL